jgi:electron transfer flavoprotein beta subunit
VEHIDYIDIYSSRPYLNLTEWSVADVEADPKQCGLSGSPTKVKKIENVVFQAKESRHLSGSDAEIDELMRELIVNHTIG